MFASQRLSEVKKYFTHNKGYAEFDLFFTPLSSKFWIDTESVVLLLAADFVSNDLK